MIPGSSIVGGVPIGGMNYIGVSLNANAFSFGTATADLEINGVPYLDPGSSALPDEFFNLVDLAPLRNSHEATQLESELKALLIYLFGQYVRPQERETNTAGTPHIGPFGQVERAVKAEGLALYRKSDDGAMRHLFRAWRARNPKRGLHLLKAYLQLLWPNSWTCTQMWAEKGATYPLVLSTTDGGNHYLTSRVHVEVLSGADVNQLGRSLRSVLPARIFLDISSFQAGEVSDIGVGIAASLNGLVVQYFEGNFS